MFPDETHSYTPGVSDTAVTCTQTVKNKVPTILNSVDGNKISQEDDYQLSLSKASPTPTLSMI